MRFALAALLALGASVAIAAAPANTRSGSRDAGTEAASTRRPDAGSRSEDDDVAAHLDLLENLELLDRLDMLEDDDADRARQR